MSVGYTVESVLHFTDSIADLNFDCVTACIASILLLCAMQAVIV